LLRSGVHDPERFGGRLASNGFATATEVDGAIVLAGKLRDPRCAGQSWSMSSVRKC